MVILFHSIYIYQLHKTSKRLTVHFILFICLFINSQQKGIIAIIVHIITTLIIFSPSRTVTYMLKYLSEWQLCMYLLLST